MNASSKYWTLCQISLAKEKTGYEYRSLLAAKDFFQQETLNQPDIHPKEIKSALFSNFHNTNSTAEVTRRAQAGLCLRCHVSHSILKACQTIESRFAGDKQFTYRDLLPFVLNDDGKALILLDETEKNQLVLNETGHIRPANYKVFAVEILGAYDPNSQKRLSLENWTFLQTKQHTELRAFLSEFGFKHLSDWALLNRVRPRQLEQFSERDLSLVEVFHQVYRRDRRQQKQVSQCLDPNAAQLKEMASLLQQRGISLPPNELIKALKQMALQVRQLDIWQSREPLEVKNLETGHYELRVDLPADSLNELAVEEQEFLNFLQQQVSHGLAQAIEQAVQAQIAYLKKSKRYSPFATQYMTGLQLYYCEGLSLKDIGPQLGMSSWDQTRRILNPGELLSKARLLMVQQLLTPILEKAQSKGLASTPPEPNYLKTLTEQIEAFLDAEIFAAAAAEIKAGKNRLMDSAYAQQLKHYMMQNL
jgi:hypothetical protein